MKLYADRPARRTRQIVGDLLLVAWVWVWVQVALIVRDATLALAAPGRQIDESATGMAEALRDAGDKVAGIPLVGEGVSAPFDGAGGAADRLAAAGQAQVEAVDSLAFWLAFAVAAVPIVIALLSYLPLRIRFVRRASAGSRLVRGGADLDLFALRALTNQPLRRLARVSDDPVTAWRVGDPDTVRELARLELRSAGLRLPKPPRRVVSHGVPVDTSCGPTERGWTT